MSPSLIACALLILTFATALNLYLHFRLEAHLRRRAEADRAPTPLRAGTPLPMFAADPAGHAAPVTPASLAGRANVIAFLSAGCPKCRSTLPDLVRILPAMEAADVGLHLVGADGTEALLPLVADSPLADHILDLDRPARQRLNPQTMAPYYIFIDDDLTVQASAFIGDADWRGFIDQMDEVLAEANASAEARQTSA